MTELDVLPKYICRGCFIKVSDFHGFYRGVHAAQQNFIDTLIKTESNLGEAEAFPLAPIDDEPSIYPFVDAIKELEVKPLIINEDDQPEDDIEDKFVDISVEHDTSALESDTNASPDEYSESLVCYEDFQGSLDISKKNRKKISRKNTFFMGSLQIKTQEKMKMKQTIQSVRQR